MHFLYLTVLLLFKEAYTQHVPNKPVRCNTDNGFVYNNCGPNCPVSCLPSNSSDCDKGWCVPGCFCKKGLLLNEFNGVKTCVPREKCPPLPHQCNVNKGFVYRICGPKCPPSCQPPNPKICVKRSCYPGCYCREGLVQFITANGEKICIIKESCPKPRCDSGFEYQECGSPCPEKCDSDPSRLCSDVCSPGCFCKKGFVLSEVYGVKTCVPREKCHQQCDGNKGIVYKICSPKCPRSCYRHPSNSSDCHKGRCVPGCYCRDEFVEYIPTKGEKICILKEDCPLLSRRLSMCDTNRGFEYQKCGSPCPERCDAHVPRPCSQVCSPGCFCKKGLVLNELNGVERCVPRNRCPVIPRQ